ncbi:MAG TPA: hypothetical protein VFC51_05375 [Chloroflexota bacterium]|nr:hypothetical protein [Chloroflexota bacterium]
MYRFVRAIVSILASLVAVVTPISGPTPARAQVPICLLGNWQASDIEGTYRALFSTIPNYQIDSVTGGVSLAIQGDGSYTLRYDGFTVSGTSERETFTTSMDGPVHGQLSESQPGSIVGSVLDSTVTLTTTFRGNTTTATMPFATQQQGGSPVDYDCDLGSVTFRLSQQSTGQTFSITFTR